jgi:hypothetical protein
MVHLFSGLKNNGLTVPAAVLFSSLHTRNTNFPGKYFYAQLDNITH